MSIEKRIDTPHGEARLVTHRAAEPAGDADAQPRRGQRHRHRATSRRWREHLPRHGITVVLLEQPWKVAGRKVATPPPTLDDGLRRGRQRHPGAYSAGRGWPLGGCPVRGPVGQRSVRWAAWRWRSRCTRRDAPRRAGSTSSVDAGCPTLVIQGERDPMGRPEEFPATSTVDLTVVPGADHGLKVPRARPDLPGGRAGSSSSPRWSGWSARSSADGPVPRGNAAGRRDVPPGDRALASRLRRRRVRYLAPGYARRLGDDDRIHRRPPLEADVPRRSTSPPSPPRTAPPASNATRCRSSTSSTAPPCG